MERYGRARDATDYNTMGSIKDALWKPDLLSKNTQIHNIFYSFSMAKIERRNRLNVTS
jgi:hypothetical protein